MTTADLTFFHYASEKAKTDPEGVALFYRQAKEVFSITYRQFFENIAASHYYFEKEEISRYGMLFENFHEYLQIAAGIISANKTLAMLDTQANADDLINAINNTDLDCVIYDDDNQDLVDQLKQGCDKTEFRKFSLADTDKDFTCDVSTWNDGDIIFYTSGSTKSSKAVVNPFTAVIGGIKGGIPLRTYEAGKTVLIPLPYHHAYGFTSLIAYFILGCPLFVSSMKTLLKDISYANPTHMALVPSSVEFLLKKNALNEELRYISVAGAYFPPSLEGRVNEKGIFVQNLYGASEFPGVIGMNIKGNHADALSVYASVRIAPDGEIIVNTPYRFKEYYKNPEDTSEMIVDGEIHTGDIGYLDENNCLHLLGRRKNMIIMENGEKVFYTDVDESLRSLPGVSDAAVIYEDGKLIAVIAPENGVSESDILKAIDDYNTTQPVSRLIRKTWIYGPKLPYTSSGKMQRSIIEKEYRSK